MAATARGTAKPATTARKRPATPRSRPAPPVPAQPDLDALAGKLGDVEPPGRGKPDLSFDVIKIGPADESARIERVPIFSLPGPDGKEREYTVLVKPPYYVALEYTHKLRAEGLGFALDYLMEEMLGAEGYAALRGYKDITEQQVGQVLAIVTRLALGRLELPKESSDE